MEFTKQIFRGFGQIMLQNNAYTGGVVFTWHNLLFIEHGRCRIVGHYFFNPVR